MDISIPYYEDKTRISNSNIGWFLNKGPAFLHKMLTENIPEEKNPVLERGTMIHEYILQPEEFQKDYVVWDKQKPFSAQQEKFCQELANTIEIEPDKAILDAYKKAYSTRGKTDDKMLSEGQEIASTLKDYIDFLKSRDERIIISPYDYQMLKKIKYNIESHKLAKKLLNTRGTVYVDEVSSKRWSWGAHEFHINWEYAFGTELFSKNIKCKSLLDSITLYFEDKKVVIMDLKTTAKLWHFEDSIDMYDYCRQLAYYTMAVRWYMLNEFGINKPSEWTFEYYIIGIDTTGSNEIRVFNIPESAVRSRDNTIHDALREILWHQMNDKWEHSRAYYEGDGSETLDL